MKDVKCILTLLFLLLDSLKFKFNYFRISLSSLIHFKMFKSGIYLEIHIKQLRKRKLNLLF